MKKCLVLVLAIVFAGMRCACASASYWDEGNDGDSWETAYIIDSAEDIIRMANNSSSYYEASKKYYKLTTDLDLTNETSFYGISWLAGHFDGQNHTVKIDIDGGDNGAALFGIVSTDNIAIRNLNVEGNVRSRYLAGNLSSGTIENCTFTGNVEAVCLDDFSNSQAGGIVAVLGTYTGNGLMRGGTVKNCRFQGIVSASCLDLAIAGGIVCEIFNGSIDGCTTLTGSIISATTSAEEYDTCAGGIVGYAGYGIKPGNEDVYTYGTTNVTNCISYAQISGNGKKGGIGGVAWKEEGRVVFSGNTWPSEYPEVGNYISSPTTPTTPDTPDTPDTPAPISSNLYSHKYTVFNLPMTWTEAKAYCESLGGHLATITSQEEYDIIMGIIHQNEPHRYWLGANRLSNSTLWEWITGEAFSFTKWHEGEPNNQGYTDIDVEQYLELTNYWADYNGQWGWNDENGDSTMDGITGFVCEWEPVDADFAPLNSEYLRFIENPAEYLGGDDFYGDIPDPLDLSHLADNPPIISISAFTASDILPAKYDPRNSSFIPPVRNQNPYGTCWSFASLGALETSYLKQYGNAPDTSELHQAWFVYKDPRTGYSFSLREAIAQNQ